MQLYFFLGKVIDFSRAYLVLYKSPVKKKNFQNSVKTTSFERYCSKLKGTLLFLGKGGGAQNFKLAGAKSLQGGKQVQGAPPPPCGRKPGL